jgi:hypothetical protein
MTAILLNSNSELCVSDQFLALPSLLNMLSILFGMENDDVVRAFRTLHPDLTDNNIKVFYGFQWQAYP